ncbi:MAG: hypothetical protein ACKVX7_03860 [Planctomycetota bacterium]
MQLGFRSSRRQILLCSAIALTAVALTTAPARAANHLIDINEVYTNADGSVQFVELLALSAFQTQLAPTRINTFDGAGAGPTLAFDFTAAFPALGNGETVLVATPGFQALFGIAPDFIMPANSISLTNGRVVFQIEAPCGVIPNCEIDAVAYGSYTGATGMYGSPAAALPSSGTESLVRLVTAFCNCGNNATDWAVGPPTPTNNAGAVGMLPPPPDDDFRRGDCNGDLSINIADAICTLGFLFSMTGTPTCLDALDGNDDEAVNIADAVYVLSFLFSMGVAPPAPGPDLCGPDPAGTLIDCVDYAGCP